MNPNSKGHYNPMDMSGKRVLVTGASSGMGRTISVTLSRLGAELVLVGRNHDALHSTWERLDKSNTHKVQPFDLRMVADIPRWFKELSEKVGGPFHGAVHAAGVHSIVPIRVISLKALEDTHTVNLYAGIALLRGITAPGVGMRGMSIVFLASVAGLVGDVGNIAYAASKGGLIAAVRTAAMELAPSGTRVNCVAPGIVQTEMTARLRDSLSPEEFAGLEDKHPLGLGHPEDVAFAVAFLLSDSARWITGTTLVVDGGYTCH